MIIPGVVCLALSTVALQPAPTELVLLDGDKLACVELRVEVDGAPIAAVWDETFARLFAFFDRNGDGTLDRQEAAHLPSPLMLQQAMGNGFTPPVGPAPDFAKLDGGDGKATPDELATFYRGAGVGTVLVGAGRLPASARLTAALVESLDADGDGKLDEAEWKGSPEVLKKLDVNDDELIGAGELVPKLVYPGAAGTLLMTPPTGRTPPGLLETLPLLLLPADRADTRWADEVARRSPRVGNNKELSEWRARTPDASWNVQLGDEPHTASFSFAGDRVQLSGWVAGGLMLGSTTAARTALTDRFENPPAQPQSQGNRRRGGDLSWLTPIADRNADGALDRKELDAWLDLQAQIARGLVLATILDDAGLFEILDASHDGALSVRELRTAWERLSKTGCATGGAFEQAKLPHGVLAVVSWGYPRTLALVDRHGPTWFQAMDRNGDGDVSRREFTGPATAFEKLDRDRDELIVAEEAAHAAADDKPSSNPTQSSSRSDGDAAPSP